MAEASRLVQARGHAQDQAHLRPDSRLLLSLSMSSGVDGWLSHYSASESAPALYRLSRTSLGMISITCGS